LIAPTASRLSYPRSSIRGNAMVPMVTMAAPLMPLMAANIAQIAMVPIASPPEWLLTLLLRVSQARLWR
jgi:hypothetical protein